MPEYRRQIEGLNLHADVMVMWPKHGHAKKILVILFFLLYCFLMIRYLWSHGVKITSPVCSVEVQQEACRRSSPYLRTWWTLIYWRRWPSGELSFLFFQDLWTLYAFALYLLCPRERGFMGKRDTDSLLHACDVQVCVLCPWCCVWTRGKLIGYKRSVSYCNSFTVTVLL